MPETWSSRKSIYIVLGVLLVLGVIGGLINDSPVPAPKELVGDYERIENLPAVKTTHKLTISASGDFEWIIRATIYAPPVTESELVWKGHLRKVDADSKAVRVFVKITSSSSKSDEVIGRTAVFTYDHSGDQPLIVLYGLGLQDKPNEHPEGFRHLGVSIPPITSQPSPQLTAGKDFGEERTPPSPTDAKSDVQAGPSIAVPSVPIRNGEGAPSIPTPIKAMPTVGSQPSEADVLSKYTASFDCGKASTAVEKQICSTPILNQLDGLLGSTSKARTSNPAFGIDKVLFQASGRTWMKTRNLCTDAACIEKTYRARITELCEMPVVSGVHPIDDCEAIQN